MIYFIGYAFMMAAVATVIYNNERDLRVSLAVALIWPWLFLLAAISKLLSL